MTLTYARGKTSFDLYLGTCTITLWACGHFCNKDSRTCVCTRGTCSPECAARIADQP